MKKQLTGLAAAAVAAGSLALVAPAPNASAEKWTDTDVISSAADDVQYVDVVTTGTGDAVALWSEELAGFKRVFAREAVDGVWQPKTSPVSGFADTHSLQLITSGTGHTVALWRQQVNGQSVIYGARRTGAGVWSSPKQLTTTQWTVSRYDAAVDKTGRVVIAVDATVDNFGTIKGLDWLPGPGAPAVKDFGYGGGASLDMTSAGHAVLAYEAFGVGKVLVVDRPAGQAWGAPTTVPLPDPGYPTDTAVNEAGHAVVAFPHDVDGADVISQVRVAPNGVVGAPAQLSPSSWNSENVAVDINEQGEALTTWSTLLLAENLVGHRTSGGSHGAGTTHWFNPAGNEAMRPSPAISDSGLQAVAVSSADKLTTYHQVPGKTWTAVASGEADQPPAVAVDAAGHGVVISNEQGADGHVGTRWLDAAGPVASLTAPARRLVKTIPVSWSTSDVLNDVAAVDIYRTNAPWNASAGPATLVRDNATGSQHVFGAQPGTTSCFHAKVVDTAGNARTTPKRCTTLPVDNTKLSGAGWTRVKAAGHYLGTVSRTKKSGKTLTIRGVKAKSLALVVARHSNGGKVRVTFNGKTLRTFSLKGKGKRVVVNLATFPGVRSGTVKVRTVSPSGKVVQVDGLVVTK